MPKQDTNPRRGLIFVDYMHFMLPVTVLSDRSFHEDMEAAIKELKRVVSEKNIKLAEVNNNAKNTEPK